MKATADVSQNNLIIKVTGSQILKHMSDMTLYWLYNLDNIILAIIFS